MTALAEDLAEQLPPELGLDDPQAVFATLWGRLAGLLGDAPPDEAAEQSDEALVTPADPARDAPALPRDTRPQAQAPTPPDWAAIAAFAAAQARPDATLPQPRCQRDRPLRHLCRRLLRTCRTLFSRSSCIGPRLLPPPWRLQYAACAGPP